jgi:hypothetical protein
MCLIVGICGKMGVGKDYLIDNIIKPFFIMEGLRVAIMAFSDAIKVEASAKSKLPLEMFYKQDKPPEVYSLLHRTATQNDRGGIGSDFWIDVLDRHISLNKIRNPSDIAIISDCRYKNEIEWIKSKGGLVIRIIADDRNHFRLMKESNGDNNTYNTIKSSTFETQLDQIGCDYTVDNSIYNVENIQQELFSLLKSHYSLLREEQ